MVMEEVRKEGVERKTEDGVAILKNFDKEQ